MVTLKKILQGLRPSHATESEQAVEDLIATFRTMTSMIHTIEPTILSHNGLDGDATKFVKGIASRSNDDVRALRILTALAVALSRTEVTAVVASDPDAGQIQVVASQSQFYALRNPPSVKPSMDRAPKAPRANYKVMAPEIDLTVGNGKFLDVP
jgi:peptidoglycan hydrolase-like protein with peptidoglycan-binding domain